MGDLDGDGIDELVVRNMEFEAEEDNLELWAWEHGGPVTIHKMPCAEEECALVFRQRLAMTHRGGHATEVRNN